MRIHSQPTHPCLCGFIHMRKIAHLCCFSTGTASDLRAMAAEMLATHEATTSLSILPCIPVVNVHLFVQVYWCLVPATMFVTREGWFFMQRHCVGGQMMFIFMHRGMWGRSISSLFMMTYHHPHAFGEPWIFLCIVGIIYHCGINLLPAHFNCA